MTLFPQMSIALQEEADILAARQKARQIAALLGFDKQDQTRVSTAVSEIARNALTYAGGGRVELAVEKDRDPQLVVIVKDKGKGIADLESIMEGRYQSKTGMGVGIAGTRRLMDDFHIETDATGTTVRLAKRLPHGRSLEVAELSKIGKELAATNVADPLGESRLQNQELLESLAALKAKQEETEKLNAELDKTNRGVVALHAELEEKAEALAVLNGDLEGRIEAAVAECQQANDNLRQSQKMEAVGQLTGGIAHDFNNLLQIISGNLEMLLRALPSDGGRQRRAAENAMAGAMRAATLTQRLLAFSRRQPLAPRPIDPNKLVDGMSDLMQRSLGEQFSIRLNLAGDLWPIEADANQLENAILNLAVNARDAMPSGGTLTITTGNTVVGESETDEDTIPGQYASLAVADTGAGMSEETLARVFEPFFTTKEAGQGTGLGLSMVYGFAKQSGGHVRIESSLGRGTTVTLFLPRLHGQLSVETTATEVSVVCAQIGETILLVEDDDGVRSYSSDTLRELGYNVLEATDGDAAISQIDAPGRIDLLLTDVMLTGALSGRDVARHCQQIRPATSVLYVSGYARDALMHNDRLDADVRLLSKPFDIARLASFVRTALDQA